MIVWIGLSYCIRQYEYYISKGLPIFIYETEDDYPVNEKTEEMDYQGKLKRSFEGRYYLNDGKVIEIKVNGKKRVDENPSISFVRSYVDDSKLYMKTLQAHLKMGNDGK